MLIDCHVHLNNYNEDVARPLPESIATLFQTMEESGVDHAVVITSYKFTPHRPRVEEIVEELADDPRVTLVEGLRWRDEHRTDLFEMEERIKSGRVKGIKLYPGYEPYPINDSSLEAVFRIASKYGVPVMIHTGDTFSRSAKIRYAHPLLVDDVAVDYPDVNFVLCHLGNPWLHDTAQVLYKNDNVYADISGLVLGDFEYEFERYTVQRIKDMILYMGDPGRQLMFGSDWPLVGMKRYVKFFEGLELPEEQRANVAGLTAARLFGIDITAGPKT